MYINTHIYTYIDIPIYIPSDGLLNPCSEFSRLRGQVLWADGDLPLPWAQASSMAFKACPTGEEADPMDEN